MPHFPEHQKTVVIPVEWKKGKWEPSYGGEMPEIREGAMGDLTLSAGALTNRYDLERLSYEMTVEILHAGSLLWARMSRVHYRGERRLGVPNGGFSRQRDRLEEAVLLPFTLKEQLQLLLRGTKPAQLCQCECDAHDLPDKSEEILSINQAYTRLSERFEPGRRSHAGNVFTKVCFTDGEGFIMPLEVLRKSEIVKLEKTLMAQMVEVTHGPLEGGESPNGHVKLIEPPEIE